MHLHSNIWTVSQFREWVVGQNRWWDHQTGPYTDRRQTDRGCARHKRYDTDSMT